MYPGYSGRGMYGATVIGFEVDDPIRFALALGYAAFEAGIDLDDLPTERDQLGLGWIVY